MVTKKYTVQSTSIFCITLLCLYSTYLVVLYSWYITPFPSPSSLSYISFLSPLPPDYFLLFIQCCRVMLYLKLRLVYEERKNICRGVAIGLNVVVYSLVIGFVASGDLYSVSLVLLICTSLLRYIIPFLPSLF